MDHILDDAALFFYENAGFSYPTGSSEYEIEQERLSSAMALAVAERDIRKFDTRFSWDTDLEEFGMFECYMFVDGPEITGYLGGIDADSDSDYRRVIEAEIAQEWLSTAK